MRDDLEHLRGLFGSYLHQDWDLDYSNISEAFADFKRSSTTEQVQSTCNELDILIRECEARPLPNNFLLEELWCYYWPGKDNMTDIEFLRLAKKELGCK